MIVDREELERRLRSPKNLANSLDRSCVRTNTREIPPPPVRAPVIVRATAGALALQSSVPEVAREFGLSKGCVREATHAHNPEVREKVNGALDRVRDLAIDRLMSSLGLLTEEKVSKSSARDIATIAANMSRVVDNVTPKQIGGNVQLILYAPGKQRNESDFEVVEV